MSLRFLDCSTIVKNVIICSEMVGFDPVHLCFPIHCFTDRAILADEIMKNRGQFIQANTEQSMGTKHLYSSHQENSKRDPINSLL